jgi:hypothetical protein
MDDQLTVSDRRVLLALMVLADETPNPMMAERFGFSVDKGTRERLETVGYLSGRVITRPRRMYLYSLTDAGWRWCRKEFGAAAPEGVPGVYRLMYGLMNGWNAYMCRARLELADVFAAETSPAGGAASGDVEQRIRSAYGSLVVKPEGWVNLKRLRDALADLPRDVLDAGLLRIDLQRGVFLVPEPNKKALSDAERAAAIRIGGEDKHLLSIESA